MAALRDAHHPEDRFWRFQLPIFSLQGRLEIVSSLAAHNSPWQLTTAADENNLVFLLF